MLVFVVIFDCIFMEKTNSNFLNNQYIVYNILFHIVILLEYLLIDYFIILILESIYKFKITEYLDIKYFKYKLRKSDWLLNKI